MLKSENKKPDPTQKKFWPTQTDPIQSKPVNQLPEQTQKAKMSVFYTENLKPDLNPNSHFLPNPIRTQNLNNRINLKHKKSQPE